MRSRTKARNCCVARPKKRERADKLELASVHYGRLMEAGRQQPIVCREEGVISPGWMKGEDLPHERQETNKGTAGLSRPPGGGGASNAVRWRRGICW